MLVPSQPVVAESLVDTDLSDRHVLAAAASAGARVLVTADVDDFGRADLERLGVSAVNPDLFLSHTMTEAMYRFTLESLASRGNRCLVCARALSDRESLACGIGPECGRNQG